MATIGQSRPLTPTSMRTPLFIFGVALALVAFLVMFAFGIVFVSRTQPTGTVPVVVAKSDIDARASIGPDDLTISSLPASAVPPNAILHISQLTGMWAVVQIYKGQAISANLVAANPDDLTAATSAYLPIPAGYVAATVLAAKSALGLPDGVLEHPRHSRRSAVAGPKARPGPGTVQQHHRGHDPVRLELHGVAADQRHAQVHPAGLPRLQHNAAAA
ncbi:MAG: hypothetical protein E6I30_00120 [Chloroflexi bacterium]|nr:MAG: hypothetical protein E6I30_00120 [Chloroflexota bacterium]